MSMKQIADWALNTVTQRGAGYADVRIVDHRQRSLATKNGKVGHAASAETLGIGIRVLVNDAWGFASTDDLSRESVDKTAAQALEIAKASATVKEEPVRLAPTRPACPTAPDRPRDCLRDGCRRTHRTHRAVGRR